MEGKKASRANGRAKATLNASIVIIGVQNSPWVLFMRTVPTMGPVQLKLTSTSVSARKNTPARPFLSLFLSAELVHLEGSTISNAPKNEAANTMKMTKKMMLGSQCVDSQLNMSAVTAEPPMAHVRPIIMDMGMVYSSTMKRPYIPALNRPAAGLPLCLRKKDTVMGTIGNTQGVSSIRKPQSIASRISPQSDLEPPSPPAAEPFTCTVVSNSSGGMHMPSPQACHSICTSTSHLPLFRVRTFCSMVTRPSQVPISISNRSS